MDPGTSDSLDALRAVHHPTRRRMITHLHLFGPAQVGTLARDLDQQVGSISHHLRMLERSGIVARAPELETDGRTSWWRLEKSSFSWSSADFDGDPAARTQLRAVERVNVDHQLARLAAWLRSAGSDDEAWRRAAFSTDHAALATAEEFAALSEALIATFGAWREAIDTDDGQERRPVFVFSHGFPSRV